MGISLHVENKTQAGRIIAKFKNAVFLASIMQKVTGKPCNPSRIYRWMHPKEKGGTGGMIPSSAMVDVLRCASFIGLVLTESDLSPYTTVKK
jgi:hypothetical protein